MADQIYAITDTDAADAFSDENYAALVSGDEHSLTRTEVEAHANAFESVEAAVEYLRANGGGWCFDDSGDGDWIEGAV